MAKEKTILKHKLKDCAYHTSILTEHIGSESLELVRTAEGKSKLTVACTYTISLLSKSGGDNCVVKFEKVSYDFIIDKYTEVVYPILE